MNCERRHFATTLDELAALHGQPCLGQRPPFHTRARVYSTDPDPFLVDLMSIRRDLAAQYVNQDWSFDLRVLLVRGGEIVEAYLFPWSVIADSNADWGHTIDAERYRATIPDDVQPEHLSHDAG
jgi:hypothetical protein